jgi:xylose isomerase
MPFRYLSIQVVKCVGPLLCLLPLSFSFCFHKVIWFSIHHVYLVNSAVRANFEFIKKLGVERWCFHDRDIAPEGSTLEVRIPVILHYLIFLL